MRRGSNLPALASFNETVIFDHVRRRPMGISRVEIASHAGLSAQTISNVCRRLIDRGMVRESRSQPTGKGKPRVMLTVNPIHSFALGLHIDPLRTTWAIFNLVGEQVAVGRAATSHTEDPEDFFDWVAEELEILIEREGIERDRILGLGVAAPGPLDPVTGIMLNPPLFYGWKNVALVSGLQRRLNLPVLLDRDAPASAVGSLWWGHPSQASELHSTGSSAFIYLGAGIGAGLIINGEVYRGGAATAGEIGHLTLLAPPPPGGQIPAMSDNSGLGPAEMVVSAVEHGLLADPVDVSDPHEVDRAVRVVFELADAGNALATCFRNQFVETLARLGLGLVNLLDLDQVIFGGPRMKLVGADVEARLSAMLPTRHEARHCHEVEVTVSSMGKFDAVRGAAALVFSEEFAPQSNSLLVTKGGM